MIITFQPVSTGNDAIDIVFYSILLVLLTFALAVGVVWLLYELTGNVEDGEDNEEERN